MSPSPFCSKIRSGWSLISDNKQKRETPVLSYSLSFNTPFNKQNPMIFVLKCHHGDAECVSVDPITTSNGPTVFERKRTESYFKPYQCSRPLQQKLHEYGLSVVRTISCPSLLRRTNTPGCLGTLPWWHCLTLIGQAHLQTSGHVQGG